MREMKEIHRHRLISAIFGAFYGLFGALGFFCLGNLYVMGVFHERNRYPNLYPFCMYFGIVSFFFCIGSLCGNIQYFLNRKRGIDEGSFGLGLFIEIAVMGLVFVVGSVGLDLVYNLVRHK